VPPLTTHPPSAGSVGEAFSFPPPGPGGVKLAGGFAFGRVGVASSAGFEVAAVLA
jgi:hypothetical protein